MYHNLIEESELAHNPDKLCTAHIFDENLAMVTHNPFANKWKLAVQLQEFIDWYQKSGLKLLQIWTRKWIKEVEYGRTVVRNHASFVVFCEGIKIQLPCFPV